MLESNIPSFGIQLVDQERMRPVGDIFSGDNGAVQLASKIGKCLRAVISCHLTQTCIEVVVVVVFIY